MALQKKIMLDNGITLDYHRIISMNKITNNSTIIEVASYIDKNQRQKEIDYYNSTEENKSINVFIETEYIKKDYDENEKIEDVYNFLKTTEKFKSAKDV